ncbi:DUF2231 domain-containing protein [Flavisolibacter nicotianae]|uniref:DUF2231 domain-containing protein n=1 Tax=Flavisolibacter nicotianae TaxID=2364882 RepID=UPI000EAC948A|nr:DUF2231 domain-containing protein [Flavisolibacter nicotianae]
MKSRASLKSHPLHPILVSFPIAFFVGAFVFDLLSLVFSKPSLQATGYHLVIAGIAGAVLAAVPGFLDFLYTVPPESSAKKRAAQHGLLNSGNLVLFIVIFFLRRNSSLALPVLVVLEAMGVAILSTAGWFGGTLVYRNQIGVDPRYAGAGKWKEEVLEAKGGKVKVARIDELAVNQMKLVHVDGKRIVIARSEKGYAAFSDHCSHRGGSLAGGAMICGTVQCPWHGSQFDVHDGSVKAGPAKTGIETFSVEEKDGAVYLQV